LGILESAKLLYDRIKRTHLHPEESRGWKEVLSIGLKQAEMGGKKIREHEPSNFAAYFSGMGLKMSNSWNLTLDGSHSARGSISVLKLKPWRAAEAGTW